MRLTRVFLDTSMSLGFDGLREIAKKADTPIGPNMNVLFMNKAMTAFKVMVNNTYLVYFRNGRRKIPLEAIKHLPQEFGGTEMEVKAAIRKSLIEKLGISEHG